MNGLLVASALDLAAVLRARRVSSEELVSAHIAEARRLAPRLHAIVHERFDEALEEARAADRRIVSGDVAELPPLWGVPCTIKESFALRGMPNSAGLVSRRHIRAAEDGVTVRRLREAGAIPIGVTNTSELCMWYESENRVYGRTNNAYSEAHIAGGSSGGEGSIVGAGASPFGLGSDVGGSIRLPAFFNGVFGHKASPGTVPNGGQFPAMEGEGNRLLATGPLSRSARDLWPLLRTLSGPSDGEPTCHGVLRGDPSDVAIGALDVLDVEDNGVLAVSSELRQAQYEAARALARRGAKVRRFRSARFGSSLSLWAARMAETAGASFASLLGGGKEIFALGELARWLLGRSPHTLPALGLALVEKVPTRWLEGRVGSLAMLAALRRELDDALGESGVMLFPSFPRTAPRHREPLLRPYEFMYTALFNALELPVTQVPLGLSRAGLPLGVQVVAREGADALTVATALALEDACGGWVPPPRR